MAKKKDWPSFSSEFLDGISESLSRKSKSIKNSVSSYACNKVYEIERGQKEEKFELAFILYGANHVQFSISIWENRWVWVDVRQPSKQGWVFEWQKDGRIGAIRPQDFTEAVVTTIKLPYINNDNVSLTYALEKIWKMIAINGPEGVVS